MPESADPLIELAQPLSLPDTAALRFLPEGPIPLNNRGSFSWVGIQHGLKSHTGSINVLNLETMENLSHQLPGRPGFAIPCETENRFVVGMDRELGFFDLSDGSWTPFCEGVDADVDNTIINDGWAFEDNLIFGTKDLSFSEKKAGLYLYRNRDKQLIRLRDDQVCSNGKAIRRAADGSLMLIDIDSPTRRIVQYPLDIDGGRLGEPEVLIQFEGEAAVPDGAVLTPDLKGLVVAMFLPQAADYGETRWYDLETGTLKCVWKTAGSPQNTCPALVEHRGGVRLIITTAIENLSEEEQRQCPNAGRIFMAATNFAGPVEQLRYPA